MKYYEIIKMNDELLNEVKSNKKFNLKVLSNVTVNNVVEIIEYTMRYEGINFHCSVGEYDQIVKESSECQDYDSVLIFWELINYYHGFQYDINNLSDSNFDLLKKKMINEISLIFLNLKSIPLVVFNEFNLSFYGNFLINGKLEKLTNFLNNYLRENIPQNFILVKPNQIAREISLESSYSYKLFYNTKSLYKPGFLIRYCEELVPVYRAFTGGIKKVLILDCDNTLWGGILGEDGLKGIKINKETYPGMVFYEIQSRIKSLLKNGVVLALCSKNNFEDVCEVFDNLDNFVLTNDDFVIKKINWNNKVENLISIGKELNLGLDSFVFLDDSDFECKLVKQHLPEIAVMQVPKNLYDYPVFFNQIESMFYNPFLNEDDLNKTKMYKTSIERKSLVNRFSNYNEYLQSLQLKAVVTKDNFNKIPRIAQLTQKTNQFNLTTNRYSEKEIEQFMCSKNSDVFSLEAYDKLGEYGLVGVCITNIKDNQVYIDTFLLSCRALGREFEKAFFYAIEDYYAEQNIKITSSMYKSSKKNKQVENFWEKFDFEVIKEDILEKIYLKKKQTRKEDIPVTLVVKQD